MLYNKSFVGFKLETAKDAAAKIGIPNGRIDEVSFQLA